MAMPDDKTNDPLQDALRGLPREHVPPATLEATTVGALRRAGLLRPSRRWGAGIGVAAGIALAFATGFAAGRTGTAPPLPTHVLFVYGASTGTDARAHAARAAEYRAWAGRRHLAGEVVGGEALADNGMLVFKPDTGAFGGIAAAVVGDTATDPSGFFLVRAESRQAAMHLAREHPHLAHGGRIVVRDIQQE